MSPARDRAWWQGPAAQGCQPITLWQLWAVLTAGEARLGAEGSMVDRKEEAAVAGGDQLLGFKAEAARGFLDTQGHLWAPGSGQVTAPLCASASLAAERGRPGSWPLGGL